MIYEKYLSKLNVPQSFEFCKYSLYKNGNLILDSVSFNELNTYSLLYKLRGSLTSPVDRLERAGYVINQVFDQVAYLNALNQYEEEYELIKLQFKCELINSYIACNYSLDQIIEENKNNKLSDFFDECAKNDASFFEIEELFTRFVRFI